ncbi:MAG TPA: CDP-alcohol phosphatidyltransferase family protein [Dehalococcoidia bacterium]|nr:CDP-alcohol phosphatidyltransferase family protein [Dehalococcoidia bacterium]
MVKLPQVRKTIAYRVTEPVVQLLAATPISPNALTLLGFLVTVGAAALIATEHLLAAGLMVLFAGFFDILDGALARWTNRTTRFGGILDSTLDRLSEAALLLGVLVLFLLVEEQSVLFTFLAKKWSILLVGIALFVSPLVSYIRARAEAMGLECQVGLFTRAERVVVLVVGLLVNQIVIALFIIVVFSFVTVGHRLVHVWQQTKK